MQQDNYKKFTIRGSNLNHGKFNIEGVSELKERDNKVSFFFKGNVNEIVKIISSLDLSDILVEEPTLEEIFMHYYE